MVKGISQQLSRWRSRRFKVLDCRAVRVFLSSTYVDLIPYRDAATKALERLGQQVGRMEVFGARPEEPTTACIDEIDRCSMFVGVYAHRYGYIAPDSEVSITESEFDHARQRGRQIFYFLADKNHPWPPAFMENGVARDKLQNFKHRIRTLYAVEQFTTEDNLGANVAASVGRFLAQFNEPREVEAPGSVGDALITGVAALSRNMAMLFVDLMRLLSVNWSPAVKAANAMRYREFLEMADQRLLDLRSTYILFARYLTPKIAEQIHPLDSQMSWILLRLRRGPDLDARAVSSALARCTK